MAQLVGEEGRFIPKALKRENDYFLAKWFWLVLHVNLLRWNFKPKLKQRSYTVSELLQRLELHRVILAVIITLTKLKLIGANLFIC